MSILIVSVQNDYTTNKVLHWFQYYNIPFKRINIDDTIDIIEEFAKLNFQEFTGYWYRRGNLINFNNHDNIDIEIKKYLKENNRKIIEYFEYKMMKKKNLNSFFNSDLNKLIVLKIAEELQLSIPKFQLLKNTKSIDKFKKIYKTINKDGNIFDYKNQCVFNVLTQEHRENIDYDFSPTLFQDKIEKKHEIRIFFIDDSFYCAAILSQRNSETSIDFRTIGEQEKNRIIPYSLPSTIQIKLRQLMAKLKMNSGVIDMIVTSLNEYIFLEVNPVGHFGLISYHCNYGIEKKIAKFYKNEKK